MADDFELLHPSDKPALLGLSNPGLIAASSKALQDLEYKTHTVKTHGDFLSRFSQFQYHLVLLEELFDATAPNENLSLIGLQGMAMSQRRHAVCLLFGSSFKTLHPMQAFQQSVHAVVHPTDADKLNQILPKIVSDHELFYTVYRDSQLRVAQGK